MWVYNYYVYNIIGIRLSFLEIMESYTTILKATTTKKQKSYHGRSIIEFGSILLMCLFRTWSFNKIIIEDGTPCTTFGWRSRAVDIICTCLRWDGGVASSQLTSSAAGINTIIWLWLYDHDCVWCWEDLGVCEPAASKKLDRKTGTVSKKKKFIFIYIVPAPSRQDSGGPVTSAPSSR